MGIQKDYIDRLVSALPKGSLKEYVEFRDQLTLRIDPDYLLDVLRILKQEFEFMYLIDLTAVDYYPKEPRFEVVYHLWCHRENRFLRVKSLALGDPPSIPSVVGLWSTANWHERECYDMFGIFFEGHPDLRRILLWEGFDGYPLRKDYPVEGRE